MEKAPGKIGKETSALEILEEAFHLLRRTPASLLMSYYLGAIPFVLGFLFFWADMSYGVDASRRLFPAAMVLTFLYILMKCMHSDFARRLKIQVTGEPPPKISFRQIYRLVFYQSVYQPLAFVVLPVALVFTVPFGWCFAFFQNVTVFGLEGGGPGDLRKRAWHQALLWTVQNNLILGILLLFSLFIGINLMATAIMMPYLIKSIFGIETVFSRSGIHLLNTTFFMTIAALTYLCLDPVIKAVYVLRCYYGEARRSGEDLAAELRIARARRRSVLAAMVIIAGVLFLSGPAAAGAAPDGGTSPEKSEVTARDLQEAVGEVMGRTEYRWRMPREESKEPPASGFWYEFFQWFRKWTEKVAGWVEDAIDWLADLIRKLFPGQDREAKEPSGWSGTGYAGLYFLLALGACAAVILMERLIRRRKSRRKKKDPDSPVITPVDLEDERIRADALPEEEWMTMARELIGRGETRLAIRALYLAALSHLAAVGVITVADYKSDREYERELLSRGQSVYETAFSFSHIRNIFEATWYGMHGISPNGLDSFMDNHGRVMSHVRP